MWGRWESKFDSEVCILVTGWSNGANHYRKESELGEEDEWFCLQSTCGTPR